MARSDDIVVRRILLEHEPHRANVVARKSPIATRLEIAEAQLAREAQFDARYSVGDLARHELEPATWALVIEQDAGNGVQGEALAIVHGDPVPVDLRHAVWASRIEWRRLTLRRFVHLAEHLARAGLIEPGVRRRLLHCLEHARHAEGREFAGEHRLCPGRLDEALRGEVVDLIRLVVAHDIRERCLIEQICRHQLDVIDEVTNPLIRCGRASPYNADHLVTLLEEELGEIGAILTRDTCDNRCGHFVGQLSVDRDE